ncbi:MAG TPA: carboxypeptidase regulatory-like domain-containing protein [Candidatus Sulfomarinibacteraceae bacterium]|nr:carboxypeptidase regulatory-like domain-containing protein [Candidatus Sulfomarinibacteraceae bacterium]
MRRVVRLVGVLFMIGAGSTLAQDTTGRMLVRTIDNGGEAPLPGVTVTIASPSLIGGARTEVTDERGEALFLTLMPGTYKVGAALHGFATQERREVRVRLGSLTAINVVMPEATFEGEIEVLAETPVVDPQQIGTEQVFDAEYIEKTAIGTWQRFIASPGANVPGVYWQSIYGSRGSENAWYVDGIEVTNTSVGGSGSSSFGIDAYQEIEIKTGGYEAEYGHALGGITSAVMKSGGNTFSGSLDARYQADVFQESGDHFDPDLRENSNLAIDATLGGPIIRDRLWFFAAFYYGEARSTPEDSPTTWSPNVQAPKAKLTWQVSPSLRATASYLGEWFVSKNSNASRWTAPEATRVANESTDTFSISIDGMLSPAMLWTGRTGYETRSFDAGPSSGDLETISHINTATGIVSENYHTQENDSMDHTQAATDLTWFLSGESGSHELKAGLAVSDMGHTVSLCSTGTQGGVRCSADVNGYYFYDTQVEDQAFPNRLVEEINPGPLDFSGLLWTGYVQDAWRPTPKITVKVGLRFDSVGYDMDRTGASVTMDRWQPRLGVAWDITGDARNLLRASAGRYMDPATMNLPYLGVQKFTIYQWRSCSAFGRQYGLDPANCPALAASFGFPWRTDPENWDPYGWYLRDDDIYGVGDNIIDPDLESAYSDQFILSYERALWPRSSVELSLVSKRTRGLFEDTCDGNIPEPTEGAPCNHYVLTNMPQLKRDYEALIVKLESRTLDWLTLLASYTLSDTKSNHDSLGFNYAWDLYPWHWANRYGYADDHHRHDLRLNGYFLLPYDFTIGFNAGWRSAFRWTPTLDKDDIDEMDYGFYYTEPRGNRKGADNTWLDLQLAKGFHVGPTHFELIVSVLNVLSREQVTGVCTFVTGCGQEFELGEPTSWDDPRRWEVGLRLTF